MNTSMKRTRKLAILILIAGALLFTYAKKTHTTEASLLLLNNVEALTIVEGWEAGCEIGGGLCFSDGALGLGVVIARD
jgi:hypothetical protein